MAKKKKRTATKRLPKLVGNFPRLGEKREATFPVDELAKRARLSRSALAGMKTAYGWDSQSKLTESEFTEKTRAWLSAGGR